MNTLIVTVGLPRSGKTTWSLETSKQLKCPIVNPDAVRLAVHQTRFMKSAEPTVWMIVRYMVRALFAAGHKAVILDATNTTKGRRKFWLEECEQGFYGEEARVMFVVFDTPALECQDRAIADDMLDLVPIIDSMDCKFEPLDPDTEPHRILKDVFAGVLGFI